MAMASCNIAVGSYQKTTSFEVFCSRKRDRDRERGSIHPYKVVEITPPPRNLGVRCFPPNLQCGESVTIEGQAYTISAVTHRYQLRKGKYEPSEKRLDVLSTGRYLVRLRVLLRILHQRRLGNSVVGYAIYTALRGTQLIEEPSWDKDTTRG
ncbi:uncharacterized protein LOC133289877 isoform X2 [Gastrolobium bilobum]|uniref:uncharacterized protein LOC133289877 isoform X2 n=1 Tax=Gastrolobium bilobum TaxID=150636 RepID=UPI002AB2C9A9|nr:uncharacterized protein LOC133289877 isoform X2 [Gastrolobium bilobum]